MFSKIRNLFLQKSLNSLVDKTKNNINKRMQIVDFDTLGRSLCVNPFLPRSYFSTSNFEIKNNYKFIKTMQIESDEDLEEKLQNINFDFLIANTILKNNLSLISTLRHYSPFLIIHKDIIISKYQVLESVFYGADMIILDSRILDIDSLKLLFDYSLHLGLIPILYLDLPKNMNLDFKFFILEDLNLLKYMPNDKIIIFY